MPKLRFGVCEQFDYASLEVEIGLNYENEIYRF